MTRFSRTEVVYKSVSLLVFYQTGFYIQHRAILCASADTDRQRQQSTMNSADRPKNALLPTAGSSSAVCLEQSTQTSSSSSSSASSSSTSLPEYRRSISTPNAAIGSKSAVSSATATGGRQHQQQSLDSMLTSISSVVHICINDVSVDGLDPLGTVLH